MEICFDELPFIYEMKKTPCNDEGIPNSLPFKLVIDEKYDLVKQAYDNATDKYLEKAYKISSVLGGNITEDEIGIGYANSMLEFIEKNFSDLPSNPSVLDIGCGTGYLLHKLESKGWEVQGIEPGKPALFGSEKYKIPIINDFFPSNKLNGKFDVVICSLVLEHIIDPADFIRKIKQVLKENGTVVIGVPNCLPYILSGDISMLFHEHWSYFTPNSLTAFLIKNSCSNISIKESSYGGLLYAKFDFENDGGQLPGSIGSEGQDYLDKIADSCEKLKSILQQNADKTIGIYVPGRIVNLLVSNSINLANLRFFDDNVNTYGHYFPGIDIKVENFDDLKKQPTDIILIMSSFFGEKIKAKIVNGTDINPSKIFTWNEIF
jgi:SAM-dependent methyltransferase